MDSSSINVPRWTANPSPTKSLLKEAVTSAVFSDVEMQSIASGGEEDGTMDKMFPFSIGSSPGASSSLILVSTKLNFLINQVYYPVLSNLIT